MMTKMRRTKEAKDVSVYGNVLQRTITPKNARFDAVIQDPIQIMAEK